MVLPNVFNQKNKTLSECRNEGSNIFIVWKIKNDDEFKKKADEYGIAIKLTEDATKITTAVSYTHLTLPTNSLV